MKKLFFLVLMLIPFVIKSSDRDDVKNSLVVYNNTKSGMVCDFRLKTPFVKPANHIVLQWSCGLAEDSQDDNKKGLKLLVGGKVIFEVDTVAHEDIIVCKEHDGAYTCFVCNPSDHPSKNSIQNACPKGFSYVCHRDKDGKLICGICNEYDPDKGIYTCGTEKDRIECSEHTHECKVKEK